MKQSHGGVAESIWLCCNKKRLLMAPIAARSRASLDESRTSAGHKVCFIASYGQTLANPSGVIGTPPSTRCSEFGLYED
jgi:hypothetical protein